MATPEPDDAAIVIALEQAALERWSNGDPDGFLEIYAEDISYFDPFTETRLDGIEALQSLYDQFRGQFQIDRFEMIDPRVQFAGDAALLTYRFDSEGSEGPKQWNTTEVYQWISDEWKIVHSHWAFFQPKLAV